MACDDAVGPRAALLLGTPLETEWETPVKFFSQAVLTLNDHGDGKNICTDQHGVLKHLYYRTRIDLRSFFPKS